MWNKDIPLTLFAPAHSRVGGKEQWAGSPVSGSSEALWLTSSRSFTAIFYFFGPVLVSAAVPSLPLPVKRQRLVFFSGRGAAHRQSCRVNQWNALLHCRSVGWPAPAPLPHAQTCMPQAPYLLREVKQWRLISQCLQNPAARCMTTVL